MRPVLRPLFALALAGSLALPVAAAEPGPDTVVAKVGNTEITLGHMIVMRAQLPEEYKQLPDDVLYTAVLDQLVRQAAVVNSLGADLSRGARLALENEERSFVAGEALSRVAEAAVTEDAIQALYEASYGGDDPKSEFNASHILLETEDEANDVLNALDMGGDFEKLAEERSIGPSGPNGGNLGWFGTGMMVAPFEEAVLALAPGEVAGPVQTQFGWHVIRLNEKRLAEAPPLEDVRAELVSQIQTDAIEKAMEDSTAAADVMRPDLAIDPAILRNRELLAQ